MRRTGGAFRRQILFERRLRQVAHPAEQIQLESRHSDAGLPRALHACLT